MDEHYEGSGLLSLIQHFRRLDWSKAISNISQPEYLTLSAVRYAQDAHPERPGVYVSVLAEELMISVSMVSKLLKSLEEKGWILRTVDKNSRRNTFVSLTEQGRQVHDQANASMSRVHQLVAEKMGQETLQQLLSSTALLFQCYDEVLSQL